MKKRVKSILLFIVIGGFIFAQSPAAFFNDGNKAYRRGDLEGALAAYYRVLEMDNNFYRAYYQIGVIEAKMRNLSSAIESYLNALKIKPDFFKCWFALGLARSKEGDKEGALDAFNQAIEIDSSYVKAYSSLAEIYIGLKEYTKAFEVLNTATKIDSSYSKSYLMLGIVYTELNQFEEAVDNLEKGVALNPKDAKSWFRLAHAHNELGNCEAAQNAAREAMDRKKNFGGGWYELGIAEWCKGDGNKTVALNSLEKARNDRSWRQIAEYEIDKVNNPYKYESAALSSENIYKSDSWNSKSTSRVETKQKSEIAKNLKPQYPADLSVDIKFTEPSGNNYLDAEETGNIVLTIMNNGQGQAYDLKPILRIKNSIQGLVVGNYFAIDKLLPGKSTKVKTSITADQSIITGTIEFEINISERNGFDLYPPLNLTIYSKALSPPELILADIGVDDLTNGNGRIEPNEVVEATAIIQNRGQGTAKTVKVEVDYGDNVFKAGNSKMLFTLGNIGSNETREIIFSFFATRKATTNLPISLEISEKRKTYDKIIDAQLSMNKVMKKATDIVIAGKEDAPVEIMDAPVLSVDVEKNIPVTRMKNKDAFAVVIGNRDYEGDIPNVDFAVRDAEYVKEYLIKTMGYRPGNIFYYNNATLSKIKVAFKKLRRAVKKDKSDVFVYYSGHGAPDPDSKQGFFVPVDADPNYIKDTGYAVNDLYAILNNMNARSQFVVIDACFSGSSDQGMILKDISPVSIEIESSILSGKNTAIFTSSTGSQVSSWYRDKKHSLFTYYFLKALQGDGDVNQDKKLTLMEIKDYIDDKVPYMAGHLINREQTPQLITSGENKNKIVIDY